MRKMRLGSVLVSMNVGLLIIAIAGTVYGAVHLLRQGADEQAEARVLQAGLIARQSIDSIGRDVQTSMLILSQRPTLNRLFQAQDQAERERFLTQFQQSSQLDGIALVDQQQVLDVVGVDLPWQAISTLALSEQAQLITLDNQGLALVARHELIQHPEAVVYGVRLLNPTFLAEISSDVGLPVSVFLAQNPDQFVSNMQIFRNAVLGEAQSGQVDALAAYVAFVPLFDTTGTVVGVLEVRLPSDSIVRSVQRLIQFLLLLTIVVVVIGVSLNVLVGRRLSASLKQLTKSAARIGQGDLLTPVEQLAGFEVGTLAASLEEMRERLLRATSDLRRQQHEAQAIITGIVEGVFTVDRERRIRYLNPQAARLLGVDPPTVKGMFCGDVLRPKLVNGVRPCAEHCPIVHARFRFGARATELLQGLDGSDRHVVLTSSDIDADQQVVVLRDETEIEATRRLRDAVLAHISHEFRTPLSAQLASLELLLDQLPTLSTEQIGQLLLALQRGTIRLTQLIDNLLESARIESGQYQIRQTLVSLDEVVESAVELVQPLFMQRDQLIEVVVPYPLPMIVGDAQRLVQVLVNLLANAHKYAPTHSIITVGGAVSPCEVTLWVEDCGPGIDSEVQQTVFQRFVRASDEPEQKGFGIGLWIVKSIITRHKGRVFMEQRQDGAPGLRACIVLPRKDGV